MPFFDSEGAVDVPLVRARVMRACAFRILFLRRVNVRRNRRRGGVYWNCCKRAALARKTILKQELDMTQHCILTIEGCPSDNIRQDIINEITDLCEPSCLPEKVYSMTEEDLLAFWYNVNQNIDIDALSEAVDVDEEGNSWLDFGRLPWRPFYAYDLRWNNPQPAYEFLSAIGRRSASFDSTIEGTSFEPSFDERDLNRVLLADELEGVESYECAGFRVWAYDAEYL